MGINSAPKPRPTIAIFGELDIYEGRLDQEGGCWLVWERVICV